MRASPQTRLPPRLRCLVPTSPDPAASPTRPDALALASLRVRGADAGRFLHGQLTQDVLALEPGAFALAALLTVQGRVVAAPWVARDGDGYQLLLPVALAPAVADRLRRYVLRAKVTIEAAVLDHLLSHRLYAELATRAGTFDSLAELSLDQALVRAGVAMVGVAGSEEWIPQMLNLDLAGAISFQKGCYTGQEIVARTQHLGRIKRRMFRLALDPGPAPVVKSPVLADGAKAGEIVAATSRDDDPEALAVLNLEARDRMLALSDGRGCRIVPLPYDLP
jgi:tRNA-modifying protein YgfZ